MILLHTKQHHKIIFSIRIFLLFMHVKAFVLDAFPEKIQIFYSILGVYHLKRKAK